MARVRERISAVIVAFLFLLTPIGGTVLVIWQMTHESKPKDSVNLTPTNKGPKLEGTNMDNFTPVATVAELQRIDLQSGNGDVVKEGDTVTVDYTGAVAATGIVFQSSLDGGKPVTFSLNGVIDGWKNGIPGMKVGGKLRLLIPAAQAYGATPPQGSGIPANADLVFDITLHKIGQ